MIKYVNYIDELDLEEPEEDVVLDAGEDFDDE